MPVTWVEASQQVCKLAGQGTLLVRYWHCLDGPVCKVAGTPLSLCEACSQISNALAVHCVIFCLPSEPFLLGPVVTESLKGTLYAQEATEAIKPLLGKYYAKDNRNVWRALWEDWDACHYAAPDAPGSGVFWYHR